MLTINEKSLHEQKLIIHKLHKQFAYPTSQHLRDADVWVGADSTICDVWKRNKTSTSSVACIPFATEVYDVVAMDLKEWKPGTYFLYLMMQLN